jgi:putative transposase
MIAYKFRLYPSREQVEMLDKTFDNCRFIYNKLLEGLNKSKKIDRGKIQHKIMRLKKEFPFLNDTYSKTLQHECYRLFSNLKGLSRLKRNGKKVGRLRFKGRFWFKTINYNQSGYKLLKTGKRYDKLQLSKIGEIKIRCHRKFDKNVKQITIKRSVNKWFAILITNEEYVLKRGRKKLGIDMGIMNFLTDSEGRSIENPLFLKNSLDRLAKAQRELSRKKKGSKNRMKARLRVAKIYEKIENQRNDFFHKTTTMLINQCSSIVIEKLNIKSMLSSSYNGRNIQDSSWYMFISMLKLKAASAEVSIIEVNSKNTTKKCSRCGLIRDMPLWKRQFVCECGLEIERDYNSAKNILALGQGFVDVPFGMMKQEALSTRVG